VDLKVNQIFMAGKIKSNDPFSQKSVQIWRMIQLLIWIIGAGILYNLIVFPDLGIHLFWNILIPVAPALLVISVGVWRNICPLATTALLPNHLGISKRKKITAKQSGILNLVAVMALFIIVPLRHAIFDMNGVATALLIISLGVVSIILGLFFEWKSAWCSGLCPIHPVEKLYGLKNKFSIPNMHCASCIRCVIPCPDSTSGIHPLSVKKTDYQKIAGLLITGGLPGFIWGWFHVPDYHEITSAVQLIEIYMLPMLGLSTTTLMFLFTKKFFDSKILVPLFSAAAVSCYYWFRVPALLGFGIFPGNGMLVDLTGVIPEWLVISVSTLLVVFFFLWIVFSKNNKNSWLIRPAYADLRLNSKKLSTAKK